MDIIHVLEMLLENAVNFIIIVLEFMGVAIIAASGIKGFYNYIKGSPDTKLSLAKGLAVASCVLSLYGNGRKSPQLRALSHSGHCWLF